MLQRLMTMVESEMEGMRRKMALRRTVGNGGKEIGCD